MIERINDKINEIETYLEELSSFVPEDYTQYLNDFKTRAACERYFEKIIESVVDIAFLVVKEKKLKIPDDDKHVFTILSDKNIIVSKLASRLKEAKGMRNIIAHDYGTVDNKLVFDSLTYDLIADVDEFINSIKKR